MRRQFYAMTDWSVNNKFLRRFRKVFLMPRTAEQWKQVRTRARQKILKGAQQVFERKGFHAASMELIARQARVSKGLAYNYFRSKEDLLMAVLETWISELASFWAHLEAEPTPVRRLARVLDRFCESLQRNPDRYRLYLAVFLESEYLSSIEKAALRSRKLSRQVSRIYAASRELFASLGASDPDAEVAFFRLLTSGLAAEFLMSPKNFPMQALKERILFYYRSLANTT